MSNDHAYNCSSCGRPVSLREEKEVEKLQLEIRRINIGIVLDVAKHITAAAVVILLFEYAPSIIEAMNQ